jgi:two-component system CheB/CheR fusion protein
MSKKKTQRGNRRSASKKGVARVERKPRSEVPSTQPLTRPNSIVGVGASAGGLEAFEQLLAALPEDSGMAFVLVQHLAPKHESILSEPLSKATRMAVGEVSEGMVARPNRIYVIPPNADMSIVDGVFLSPLTPDRARRMPIDTFLRSLADDQQGRAIGVILSGTASDGTLGIQAIKAMGGVTFAQDDQSAKYNAMPRSAVAAGDVDFVLPPDLIARELARIARHVHIFAPDDGNENEAAAKDETLDKI